MILMLRRLYLEAVVALVERGVGLQPVGLVAALLLEAQAVVAPGNWCPRKRPFSASTNVRFAKSLIRTGSEPI